MPEETGEPQAPGEPGAQRLAVSLDVSAVPAAPVGAGRYTIELASALASRGDVALTLWARRGDDRWRTVAAGPGVREVRPVVPRRRPTRLAWEQLAMGRALGSSGVALHHGPHYTMPARSPVPCVVTVHDLTFFEHPEWHERVKVPVFRRAIRRAARRAEAVVCVSQDTAERFERRCRPHGRIFVVPHGVDHARFRPADVDRDLAAADEAQRAALGVRGGYLLFVGTMEPRKAVPTLIRAFDDLAERDGELSLVLAGAPGWGAEAVGRAVAGARHGDRVLRLGYVPETAVPALLRGARATVYPAIEEGFGLPALEALACGSPLVTTRGTAMAALAGEAAVLVAPGSHDELAGGIEEALAGGASGGRRLELGLSVARTHTWERSAEGHLEAYRFAAS